MDDMQRKSEKDHFDFLSTVLCSQRFLLKMGIGNEVPFFIYPYHPKEQNIINGLVSSLEIQLKKSGVVILPINLYDLSIEIIQKRGIWDRVLSSEPNVKKTDFNNLLRSVLDTEKHLVPAIAQKMQESPFDILLLYGIGEVYPYIRSHTVLNNLQSTAKEKPTVLMFPGRYVHSMAKGASLELFGRLQDDRYYRAFNLAHYLV
ncbi:MAG: hypothetical protein CL609_15110 [Anaerolineaceae bacterium]|nr:hypothetical protein [Anaerolineaceae bacterium]